MNKDIEIYTATSNISVVEAMERIDKGAKGILFIIDECEKLIGCITDGDIRRWLIHTADLKAPISSIMVKQPKSVFQSDNIDTLQYMKKYAITALPVLDCNQKIVRIDFENSEEREDTRRKNSQLTGVPIVIMAGGKGTRLYPYTKILPKPLIPIGDVPIIERIINRYLEYDINNFYLTVNYKKGMIKSYFEDLNPNYNISYVIEDKPLGTGGSLTLIEDKFDKPFFVANCDILIDANYADIYRQHVESGCAITIVSALKNNVVPYGVLHVGENAIVKSMEEKPSISYFVNTGMYIINPELIKLIPKDTFYHMPQLAEEVMQRGMKVGMYPVSEEAFLDMGEFEELHRMEKKISAEEKNNS